jgi:hypothetical protein
MHEKLIFRPRTPTGIDADCRVGGAAGNELAQLVETAVERWAECAAAVEGAGMGETGERPVADPDSQPRRPGPAAGAVSDADLVLNLSLNNQ